MADSTKTCTKCGETKPVTDFRIRRQKGRNDHLSGSCRICEASYHRSRVEHKKQSSAWRHRRWQTNLKSKYGITKSDYIDIMLAQDFCCILCHIPQLDWRVDHDHACCDREGSCGDCVRGLLCDNCNKMLGHARDDADTLRRAADYLEVHRASPQSYYA